MEATSRYVEDEGGAFRLVFESDLTNEPAVRERVDRVTLQCAEAISEVIAEDTGLPGDESMLLAVGLGGLAQVVARYWLSSEREIPRDEAVQLLASLAWRGIAGFPLHARSRAPRADDRGVRGQAVSGASPRGGPSRCSPAEAVRREAPRTAVRGQRAWRCNPGGTEAVEVKIGVQHAPREIVLESGQTAEEVESAVAEALAGKPRGC